MGAYQQGTGVIITETFRVGATPTTPTGVIYRLRSPIGVVTEYEFGTDVEVTNPSVGVFVLTLPGTLSPGEYVYDIIGTGTVVASGRGDFEIIPLATATQVGVGPIFPGPCTAWIDAGDVADCCTDMTIGSNVCILDDVALEASQLLYELSGRRHSGVCERTVRPCATSSCWDAARVLYPASGWGQGWMGWEWGSGGASCSCVHVSEVTLPGYPVVSIVEVLIDGVVVDPATYRLDGRSRLVRVTATPESTPLRWPSCQDLSMPSTQVGTWEVTYRAGQSPPMAGERAAAQLACELYKACPGSSGEQCTIPGNATRISRQGVTIERAPFTAWARGATGAWSTGLAHVDAFLAAYNPQGLRRRPTVMSPDVPGYGRLVL